MSNPKVFEFAKEMGLETLVLMDKIREWKLPVKNHMTELSPEMVEEIKLKLNPGKAGGVEKKAALVKKKKPTKKVTESTAGGASPATNPTARVVRRKAGAAEDKNETASELALDAGAEDAAEKVSGEFSDESGPEVVAPADIENSSLRVSEAASVAEKADMERAKLEEAPQQQELGRSKGKAIEQVALVESAGAEDKLATSEAKNGAGVETSSVGETQAAASGATAKGSGTLAGGPQLARKKEVIVGQSGYASEARPLEARRNIVGRMDLSRVSSPQQGSRSGGGYAGGDRAGGRPGMAGPRGPGGSGSAGGARPYAGGGQGRPPMGGGAMGGGSRPSPGGFGRTTGTSGGLRTGFVAQAAPDFFDPSVDRKSKFEERNKKFSKGSPGAEGGGSGGSADEEEEFVFISSEFKKREMVFQPKKKKLADRASLPTLITQPKASKRVLKVHGSMKLADVAIEMGLKSAQLIKALMQNGVMANVNMDLDYDTIALIVPEFGWEAENVQKTAEELILETAFGNLNAEKQKRPPIVAVMGHVDHGKTSLLDAIRNADVAGGEAGGITQHIGAYQVQIPSGELITFLDTPGHAAFTAMRARGANVTDIAIVVVAADDGVMPQTAEAISHAKAAGVPIIVAINKMDKPGAQPERIKQQLTEYELVPEEWGGTTIFCEVSALKKTGIQELLEQILLVAEVQELKANADRSASGRVIEARLEKGRGAVATLLVLEGTIHIGDLLVAGASSGKVRSLMNYRGERVEVATPGMPIEVLGLNEPPAAGDAFDVVQDERTMERVVELRREAKELADKPQGKKTLEEIFSKVKQGDQKILNIILKADVAGSEEAIKGMFEKLASDLVKIKLVYSGVGGITESDILLAKTSKAIVIGFNTRPDNAALNASKQNAVEVRTYSIVYELIDDLKRLMSGLLEPEIVEEVHGKIEVRNLFNVPKVGTVAGCFVQSGKVARNHLVRLIRDGVVIYSGKLASLKRFKDDAKEVAAGFECGLGIENYNDLKVGDEIEAYSKIEKQRSIEEHQLI